MYPERLEYKKDALRIFDGRCRLLSAFVLIAAALTTTSYVILGGMIFFSVITLVREVRVTALRLVQVNAMAAALWLPAALPAALPADLPATFGFDPSLALLYTLRINCAALLSMGFMSPMGISVFAASMAGLGVPQKMVTLFILSYRYIFLLYGRLFTALASMRLRCTIQNDGYRWRSISAVFASVLTSAVFRGKEMEAAMVCRGFDGVFPVTAALKWKPRDGLLLTACVVFLVFVIIGEYEIWKS